MQSKAAAFAFMKLRYLLTCPRWHRQLRPQPARRPRPALSRGLGVAALLLGLAPAVHAQQVLLQNDVASDTLRARTGPNRRYFGHLYASYALALGPDGLGVKGGSGSSEFQVGGRLKRRLGPFVAFNADLRYAYLHYTLAPDVARPAPLALPHEHETLSYHQLQGEASLRFNVGRRRGNVVGRYLDLLAYGGPALATNHATEDDSPSGGRREVIDHQPSYLARWQGGVGARLGSNSVALVGRYRLSDALRPVGAVVLPEPPRWMLGLEIGWF
jgi:hypothetical protein